MQQENNGRKCFAEFAANKNVGSLLLLCDFIISANFEISNSTGKQCTIQNTVECDNKNSQQDGEEESCQHRLFFLFVAL